MKVIDRVADHLGNADRLADPDPLLPLVLGRATTSGGSPPFGSGVVVGELIGMTDEGRTPLVVYPGQTETAAVAARSILDLDGAHIGRQVVLGFDGADPAKPIIMGLLRDGQESALDRRLGGSKWRGMASD